MNPVIFSLLLFFTGLIFVDPAALLAATPGSRGERVIYTINPLGRSEYQDLGLVDFQGHPARLIIFETHVFGFDDVETIYCDINTLLPYQVERNINMWLRHEFIREEYDQTAHILKIKKFKGGKQISEIEQTADGPIENAILLPFTLRKTTSLPLNWTYTTRLPNHYTIKLAGIETVRVPAGKFTAYHFVSEPEQFEIWISKDSPQIPLKISGLGKFKYRLYLKEYYPATE